MWMGVFMLLGEMALEIRLLAKRGKGLRAIAREVGVSRNTVRRYLRDGDAERYRPRPRRSGKLAAFDDYIAKRVAPGTRVGGTEDFWLIFTLLGVTMSQKSSVTQIANLVP